MYPLEIALTYSMLKKQSNNFNLNKKMSNYWEKSSNRRGKGYCRNFEKLKVENL